MATGYETFRSNLVTLLIDSLDEDRLKIVMAAVDQVALDYDIKAKSTDLIVYGDEMPQMLKYYLASKRLENLSLATIESYKGLLMGFFKAVRKPIENVVANDIRCYLAQYKIKGIADSTIDLYRRILSGFFQWLVTNEYIIRNPCAAISPIKYQATERQPLSGYDLEVIRISCITLREKALVDLLFSTGCRVSECAAIKKSDIDWQDRSIIIRHGKGDKRRTVYFNPESEVSLKRYLDSRNDTCDALFIRTRHGIGPLSTRAIERELKEIRERAHIEAPLSPHILRHTFATTGLRAGMPIEQLQALMGHSKPDTTLIYAKLDKTDLKRAHQQAFS